nr:diguanylate cyclase [Burkholderia ubonensis]
MNCVVAAEVAKRHNAGRWWRGTSCAGPGPAGETAAANPLQAARLRASGAYATAFRSRPPRFLRGKSNLYQSSDIANPPPETLLRIIAAQTEIARLGLDLGSVMAYVADLMPRLTRAAGAPFEFEGRPLALGVSVGIAVLPDDGTEMDALIEHADQAMYEVKRSRPHRAQRNDVTA